MEVYLGCHISSVCTLIVYTEEPALKCLVQNHFHFFLMNDPHPSYSAVLWARNHAWKIPVTNRRQHLQTESLLSPHHAAGTSTATPTPGAKQRLSFASSWTKLRANINTSFVPCFNEGLEQAVRSGLGKFGLVKWTSWCVGSCVFRAEYNFWAIRNINFY